MGFFKSLEKSFRKNILRPLSRLGGNDKYGNYSAWGMAPSEKSANIEAGKAQAEAEAAAKQALFEASSKAGLERLALKRKRGFSASMIVNPASTFGSGSTFGS